LNTDASGFASRKVMMPVISIADLEWDYSSYQEWEEEDWLLKEANKEDKTTEWDLGFSSDN